MFKPTFLYIKRHALTGMLYFGKTNKAKPEVYKGSGKYWTNHIKKHGIEHVETLWYCLFVEEDTVKMFAEQFSLSNNIVLSEEWANLKIENGLDGGRAGGWKHSAEIKEKMSLLKKGKSFTKVKKVSPEGLERIAAAQRGKKMTPEHCQKISIGNRGKKMSPEMCAKMSVIAKNRSVTTEMRRLTTIAIKYGKASPYPPI